MKSLLKESKKDCQLAVLKCLTGAQLSDIELKEVHNITYDDLMSDHGCDLYMAEQVKLHAKKENHRQRAQNLYTRPEKYETLYPTKPQTRSAPIAESKVRNIIKRILREQEEKPIKYAV